MAAGRVLLTERQTELLAMLVHAYQTTEPPRMFIVSRLNTGDLVIHPGIQNRDVFLGDLEALHDERLIRLKRLNSTTFNFDVTPFGIEFSTRLESGSTALFDGVSTGAESRSETIVSTEYFVAHEFNREQIDDLRSAIDQALEESGMTPYYADQELREGHIFTGKILPKIASARFGIYEISNPNKPNVFLELGAAIATDRPYVIICKQGTSVPADLAGLDRIEYSSLKDLTVQLKEKLTPYVE